MIPTLDLFCGAGGLTLGFEGAGFQTVAAVEFDSSSVETFLRHSPAACVYRQDVRDLSFRDFANKVDVIIGGPPCQPFSTGGHRKADEDHRDMVPEFLRAVTEARPYAFVMENVPGIAVGDRKPYLFAVIAEFQALGYQVVWKVLHADAYGVPQRRSRLFVIGMRDRQFVFPRATHGPGLEAIVRVGDVITNEPKGEPNTAKVIYAKRVDLRPSPYHGLLFNGGGRPLDFSQPSPTIISSAGGNKTPFVDTLRIVPEYHAFLLNGGTPRSGEVPGARRLTVAECATLQSFPESLTFCGPQSAQYRQIGNAVPPLLAKALAAALRDRMHLDPRETDETVAEQISFPASHFWRGQ